MDAGSINMTICDRLFVAWQREHGAEPNCPPFGEWVKGMWFVEWERHPGGQIGVRRLTAAGYAVIEGL